MLIKKQNSIIEVLFFLTLILFSQKLKSQEILIKENNFYGLSKIWQEVNYNYAYLRDSKVNWDSLYISTIPKLDSVKSIEDYYDLLSQFICVFHEGHTFVQKPEIKESKYGIVSIYPYWYNGDYYVVGFSKDYKNKLDIGAKVIEINGFSTLDYFNKFVFPIYNIPYNSAKEYLSFKLFYGKLEEPLFVKFQNPNGKVVNFKILRKKKYDNLISKPPKLITNELFNYKKIGSFDYIRISSFENSSIIKSFESIIDTLTTSKGIIIDLRSNSGGNSAIGTSIIQYFTNDTLYINGKFKFRENNSYYKALSVFYVGTSEKKYYKYYDLNKYKDTTIYHKNRTIGELSGIQLVLLTNSATASAAESFIIELKRQKKITVIGTNTYGSTTLPLIINLPYGGKAFIASQFTLDEKNNVYRYTKPDIEISISVENKIKGIDEVLNRALSFLQDSAN